MQTIAFSPGGLPNGFNDRTRISAWLDFLATAYAPHDVSGLPDRPFVRRGPQGADFTLFMVKFDITLQQGTHFHAWDISRNAPKARVAAGNRRFVDGFWDLVRFRLVTSRPGDARRNLPFRKQSYARRHRGHFSDGYKRSSHVIGEL